MISKKLANLWTVSLLVAVVWQLALTLVGVLFEQRYSDHDPATMTQLSHMAYWDAGWFLSILKDNAYELNGAAPVFYPLFPLAVATIKTLSLGALSFTAAALIVNTLATWLAVVALARIAEHFVDGKYKWLVVVLFLTSPAAIFLHFFYAEAIFCALAFWAYLFALRRQWVYMAIALSFLAIVKIPALLIIGLCGLEFLRSHQWSPKKIFGKHLLSFAIVPLGFIGYGLYLQKIRGDFLGMMHGYSYTNDWAYHVLNPNILEPIWDAFKLSVFAVLERADDNDWVLINAFLPLAGLCLLGLVSLYGLIFIRGKAIPLGIAGLASIVFFTLNSNVISVHRYLLPCFILYIVPVVLIRRFRLLTPVVILSVIAGCILQVILYMFFVGSRFAG